MSGLLSLKSKPDALLALSDKLTTGCLRILNTKKIKVPADMGLIGFSNSDLTELIGPPLSIIKQPAFEMGEMATDLLIQLIESKRPVTDFEIKKTDYAHTLFVKDERGNQYPIRKIWGFSDGENLFIKSADIFFKLEKYNNNFYCWASKNVSMVTTVSMGDIIALGFLSAATGASGGRAGKKTKAALFLKLYQLDLETGHLY